MATRRALRTTYPRARPAEPNETIANRLRAVVATELGKDALQTEFEQTSGLIQIDASESRAFRTDNGHLAVA